jgi:hypothetical protein
MIMWKIIRRNIRGAVLVTMMRWIDCDGIA